MSISSAAAAALDSVHDDDDYEDNASQASYSRGSSKAPSITDLEGDEVPDFASFDATHCRAIFKYKGIPDKLVCGNPLGKCRREGHGSATDSGRGAVGVYKVMVHKKQLNGILETHMSQEQFKKRDVEERAQMRQYALELGSGGFGPTSVEEEVSFVPAEQKVSLFSDHDEPFDQKMSLKLAPASDRTKEWYSSYLLKADKPKASKPPPLMTMTPKIPDISIPVPKQQDSPKSSRPRVSTVQYGGKDDSQEYYQATMEAVRRMEARMNRMEDEADAFKESMRDSQRETTTVLSALEKAMVALANAQVTQAQRSSVHSPVSAAVGSGVPGTSAGAHSRAGGGAPRATATPSPAAVLDERDQLPPSLLLGADRDKEKDEMFGMTLRSELKLKQDLSPPGVPSFTRDDLAANMVDVVSLPGTFSGSEETTALDGTHQVAEAMRELMAQNRGDLANERVRVDTGWRSARRISLQAVKNAEQLQAQYGNLTEIADEVLSHFNQSTLSILQAGHLTDYVAEQWAQNGFYARIVRDSMVFYTDLHLHLLNIHLTHGWERVGVDLKYHCNKLWMIRSSAGNRLVCLCKTYCYLRNGKRNSWTNDDLLSKRMDHLHLTLTKQGKRHQPGSQADKGQLQDALCRKCHTNCHGPEVTCPWKNLKDSDARKAAAAWMVNPVAPQKA